MNARYFFVIPIILNIAYVYAFMPSTFILTIATTVLTNRRNHVNVQHTCEWSNVKSTLLYHNAYLEICFFD